MAPDLGEYRKIRGYPVGTQYSFNFSGTPTTENLESQLELGSNFISTVDGEVNAIAFYKPSIDMSTSHQVNLWLQSTGENLATATSSSESGFGLGNG